MNADEWLTDAHVHDTELALEVKQTIDKEIEQAVADINALAPSPEPPKEQFPFENLAQQTADAAIEVAERALDEAQSFLKQSQALLDQTKQEAENYLKKMIRRGNELRARIDRQNTLGNTVISAFRDFDET